MMTKFGSVDLGRFGPGLLLAATAIGVSHIVQSVQAGGTYGPIFIIAILFSHLIKYPFFLTAPKYSSHTKKSLLTGYFEIHPFFLILFLFLTFLSMFSLQSVVTLITAAVFENIFHFQIPIGQLSSIILLLCALILFFGRYKFLDKIIKPIILILFLATVIALFVAVFGETDPNKIESNTKFSLTSKVDFLFLIAFLGWMPCPLDCVVWNSLWTKRKQEEPNNNYGFKEAKLDFQTGYVIACILAILFLILGYFIFYQNNITLDSKAVPFIGKFLSIYTIQFGQIAFYIIAVAALFTMFSTTITCLDAYPRIISKSLNVLSRHYRKKSINEHVFYNYFLLFTVVGTILVLLYLLTNMHEIIMFATLTSFVSTAILVILHQIINLRLSKKYDDCKMSRLSVSYANICIIIIVSLSIVMIYNLFN
ncbi:MAG: divalent metal cation transporter [Rickettsiales bacterium]|jgi:Mn2+/Fe2+ NRAMP family transporter|nr:divalent metal cation transporter [Rickettsiales bacterium]